MFSMETEDIAAAMDLDGIISNEDDREGNVVCKVTSLILAILSNIKASGIPQPTMNHQNHTQLIEYLLCINNFENSVILDKHPTKQSSEENQ
ncbi:hypothetical protein VTN00DRAFT_5238 [Thermoascus crustaceus]|uniref:uncharacterized protein n=1 Tax=Thermoascus crustaceus TaxID=5088 RepID=UPI0037436B04